MIMADRNSTAGVVGNCFVLDCGGAYMGCVSVQQDEFYSTVCSTYDDAMLEARKLAAMLQEDHVIAKCVCRCGPRHRAPDACDGWSDRAALNGPTLV
jgi:hypothetical protein